MIARERMLCCSAEVEVVAMSKRVVRASINRNVLLVTNDILLGWTEIIKFFTNFFEPATQHSNTHVQQKKLKINFLQRGWKEKREK